MLDQFQELRNSPDRCLDDLIILRTDLRGNAGQKRLQLFPSPGELLKGLSPIHGA